jgi:predicted Zn-dependent peptidase
MSTPNEAIAAADQIDALLDHTMSKEEIETTRKIILAAIEKARERDFGFLRKMFKETLAKP